VLHREFGKLPRRRHRGSFGSQYSSELNITAILFDFDHTLGLDHHLEFDVIAQLAQTHCARTPATDQIDATLARFRSGKEPLDTVLLDAFRTWGCPEAQTMAIPAEFRAEALREAPRRVTPLPAVPEMLAQLRERNMPIGILSNGWTELQLVKARTIGFPGPVFVSEAIGVWKPDPRAFQIAARRMSLDATSTLYVGDEPAVDIVGAKAAGMLAGWADFEGKPYPSDIARPDLTIKDWREFTAAIALKT
jgi:putative hydrolase of the HAD superfamily